jgi:hypothetical protein
MTRVRLFVALLSVLFVSAAYPASTVTEGPWNLYAGTSTIKDAQGTAIAFDSLGACIAGAEARAARTYTCRMRATIVVTSENPAPVDDPPQSESVGPSAVLYTDLLAGPAGAPLTVCGHFPADPVVSIGGIAAPVLASQSLRSGYDCVRVAANSSGAISLNGEASALTYTVQPGNLLYVSLTGDDATAIKGDPAKPWRHVQGTAEKSAALGAATAGDVLILRGGEWSDVGYGGRWFRFLTRGDVAVVSYPGEDVHYAGNRRGGIHGPDSGHFGQAPNVVISGLRITSAPDSTSDGAPVNLQYGANGWRVVNNDLSWPVAPAGMRAAGLAGHGSNVAILGNTIHDIAGGAENHGIYIDGGNGGNTGYEIAHNLITRVTAGNLLQIYDPLSQGVRAVKLHDNVLSFGGRYGLNLAVQTVTLEAWANVITDTVLSGVRLNFNSRTETDVYLHDNVLTNVNTVGSPSSAGTINCDSRVDSGRVLIERNNVTAGAGAKRYYSQYGQCPALQWSGNTWAGIAGQTGP